jgi:hypothetical protein
MSVETAQHAPASMQFSYDGLCVRVECANENHLRWLDEFLSPQFERADDAPYSWRVVFSDDEAFYAELYERGPRPDGALLDCFALDAEVIRLPAWNVDDGSATVFEERYPAFFSVDPRGRVVSVVAVGTRSGQRIALMRAIRELAMNHSLRSGGLFLHASASLFGRRGIVVTGPKSAGKTTLLVYLLSHGARCVANDRVLATPDGGGFRLHGMPTLIAIRPGTFEYFPEFRDRFLERSYYSYLTIEEARTRKKVVPRTVKNEKIGCSPAQFLDLLGAEPAAGCDAGVVIFPRVTGDVATFELERLDPAEAARRFAPSLLGVHPWKKNADIFSAPDEPEPLDAASIDALCKQLGERVGCYECRLGPDAYRDLSLAEAVASLAEARS